MSEMSREEVLELLPAYVLDALESDARQEVDGLLIADSEAQQLLQQYRQIESVLPLMAVHRSPSTDLRERFLERLHEETAPSDEPIHVIPFPEKPKRKGIPLRRRYLVSMVATVVIAIVGLVFVLTSEPEAPSPQVTFYEISNQSDAERITIAANADSVVEGDLVISSDRERAALRLKQLPVINADQAFQLWMVDENGPVSGGVYPMPEDYALYLVIPNEKPIDKYVRFGVSLEPAGGSPLGNAPSGERVFSIALPPPAEASSGQ